MHWFTRDSIEAGDIMSIAISQLPSSQNLYTGLVNTDGGNNGRRPTEARARVESSEEAAGVDKESPQRDRITLSATQDAANVAFVPAAPYAEVWKHGRKIAEIDSRGEVSVYDGIVAAPPAAGTGLALAAQRATLIARAIGGEIRVAGMPTDVPTLAMQARLSAAYK